MRIENLREERNGNRVQAVATVQWEDSEQPTHEVFFQTDETYADSLTCNPHAFLVGCVIPAMHHGEKRIFIDEEICPELRDGLITVLNWIRHWYYDASREVVQIEARTRSKSLTPGKPDRAGLFFSGGVDSYASLRMNRLNFPPEHPGSIKDALVVYGLHNDETESFKQALRAVSEEVQNAGVIAIPVYTNVVSLGHGWDFWGDELEGAALSSIAHVFTNRLNVASIGCTFDISTLIPHASHPLLDPNYSSHDLRIRHDGITLSRLEKVKLVAGWENAFQHLRVCNDTKYVRPGMLNCGQCEKCIRTMLAFLALGVLQKSRVFLAHDVSEELVRSKLYLNKVSVRYYPELLGPLEEKGRKDLVTAIKAKINQYERSERLSHWKTRLKRLDRKYLNSRLVHLKRTMLPKTNMPTFN